jgi:magnesium transporter
MIHAYRLEAGRLRPMEEGAALSGALWVDLFRPGEEEATRVLAELGVEVPTLEDMEEIEVSNRLYREPGADYMTVVLPGHEADGRQVTGPVTFILTPERMVTVRHHAPRPFQTFPTRAERSSTGCETPERLFLGLVEEIVARLADHIEGASRTLDGIVGRVYAGSGGTLETAALGEALRGTGQVGEVLGRVRLGLLTVERMLSVWGLWTDERGRGGGLRTHVKSLVRDIQALEVHADFLAGRVSLASDTTLGLVNLQQNQTVRIVSVVAVLFLPPTLIGTVYGMNFDFMPELDWRFGYPLALGVMALSAVASWAWFRWRGWL